MGESGSRFADWIASLEARHLREFTFSEVARALRALSSIYVERRHTLAEGAALGTAGKRAAFALFYGPLHYVLIAHVVGQLPGATTNISSLIDMGCGTGASSAAWATACGPSPRVLGIDRNAWALGEASETYRAFGLLGKTQRADVVPALEKGVGRLFRGAGLAAKKPPDPFSGGAVLAAFAVNELSDAARDAILPHLLERGRRGDRVLVVEPIAGGVARWWPRWRRAFEDAGGRGDQWRFRAELPAIVAKLDRAAGLDHREITGRSLWIGGRT